MIMKRFVLLIMIFVMAIATSYAEGYSFRNGIAFGDDVDTVRSKESEKTVYNTKGNCLQVDSFTIGTIKDVKIWYYFTDDDSLNSIHWVCGSYFQEKDAKETYKALSTALSEKYGKPLNLGKGKHYTFLGDAIDYAESMVDYFKSRVRGEYYGINEYQEWDLTVTEDIHIKIDLVRYSGYQSFRGQYWDVRLSYDLYSVSQNAMVEEKKLMDVKDSV